jgi:ORF6N domain
VLSWAGRASSQSRVMPKTSADSQLAALDLEGSIILVRGARVMLDADLAQLYGVETRALLQAVRRNPMPGSQRTSRSS